STQVVSVGQYAGVSWSNQALSNPADFSFENAIGVIPSGEAVAFWITADFVNGCNTLYAATYSSGVWSSGVPITPITESIYTRSLQYTIDDTTKDVTVTWQAINLTTYVSELKSSDSNLATNVWTSPLTITTL
ncbi:MAG: hypothetical protein Q8K60_08945, partial [Parachlamydiaceae bacterium]|nr:hypothetical protein [Parachlamydiaceae bacterium]